MAAPPHVFISYSHDSTEHIHRVLTLAQWLRTSGVEAWLDAFEESPPQGWPLWCYEQVERASYVLVVCTETYKRRVLRRESEGVGRGVAWEGAIITNEIYDATRGQHKFIPIVWSQDDVTHVPFFLRGFSRYDLSEQHGWEALLRRITGQPEHIPVAIGEVIDFPVSRLQTPLPVVPVPQSSGSENERRQAIDQSVRSTVGLDDVIAGTWIIQAQAPGPDSAVVVLRIKLSKRILGRRDFRQEFLGAADMKTVTGSWEILSAERLLLRGNTLSFRKTPGSRSESRRTVNYDHLTQFFSITPSELHGVTSPGDSVVWRRVE